MNKIKKTYCHKCKNETNQKIAFDETEHDIREIFFESLQGEARWAVEQRDWLITQCNGCEMLNMRVETSHIGKKNTSTSRSTRFYPSKIHRIPPAWIFGLDRKYIELLVEVYTALNNDLFVLTSMGLRTLFDILLTDKVGNQGSFKERINKFTNEQYLNPQQKELLEAIIEAGSASAHRGYKADKETLLELLDMSEHILKTGVLQRKSKVIHERIPKREK